VCHRYNIKASVDDVVKFLSPFQVSLPPDLLPSKDYYPLYDVLVLRMTDDEQWTVEPRSWGFLPKAWKPSDRTRTSKAFQRGKINARSETVHSTWPWRFAFPSQRCVMLASSFYEPSIHGGDTRYEVPGHSVFAIAGLWDEYEGDDGKGNEQSVSSCVMLTTDANPLVASTRKGRMRQPVLLTDPEAIQRYCSLEVREHDHVSDLFTPWPDAQMTCEEPAAQKGLFEQ